MIHAVEDFRTVVLDELTSLDSDPANVQLFSAIKPWVTNWMWPSPHEAPIEGMSDSETVVECATVIFLANLFDILRSVQETNASLAFLNTGIMVKVPTRTRVGDRVCSFSAAASRDQWANPFTTFLLRPIDKVSKYGNKENYIRTRLTEKTELYCDRHTLELMHFTHVAFALDLMGAPYHTDWSKKCVVDDYKRAIIVLH
jgi:hypothetical protein